MLTCPVCQRETTPAAILQKPYIYGGALTFACKIAPHWQPSNATFTTAGEEIS